LDRKILDECLITYEMAANRIALFDQRIEEQAAGDRYRDKVKRLSCFIGIKTYTSLSLIVETSDFQRFAKTIILPVTLAVLPVKYQVAIQFGVPGGYDYSIQTRKLLQFRHLFVHFILSSLRLGHDERQSYKEPYDHPPYTKFFIFMFNLPERIS
jgi:hypothetical protein